MRILLLLALGMLCSLADLSAQAQREVVVYTALDRNFSEPILAEFEQRTGIRAKPVYDTEATKTVGLYNRIVAERARPVCDVFWNNEIARTLALEREGLLVAYHSPSARDIPAAWKSPQGLWTGFAARARVIICNTNRVKPEEMPDSIFDLLEPRWKGQATIALPLFGTTNTHAATLFSYLKPAPARHFFEQLKANDIKILAGNATVRDDVAAGILAWGLTDTDDAYGAILKGAPVKMIYPDQDGMGTLIIPNTLGLIAGGPNPEAGKALIDFLLLPEIEQKLAASPSAQIPVRESVPVPPHVTRISELREFRQPWERLPAALDEAHPFLSQIFLR